MNTIERIPPHDLEAEQAMVASCLASHDAMVTVQATGLQPLDCYRRAHQLVYAALCDLARAGRPTDLVTLRTYLADRHELDDAGGYGYLIDLASSIPTTVLAEFYARVVLDKSRRRDAIRALEESLPALFDGSSEDPVGQAQARMLKLDGATVGPGAIDFNDAVEEAFGQVYAKAVDSNAPGMARAHTTGIARLDERSWIEPGDLTILGARPSVGKTALALQMMLHVAGEGGRVVFDSLEMRNKDLALRYLAMKTHAPIYRLRNGNLGSPEIARLQDAYRESHTLPIRVDALPGRTAAQLIAGLRRELMKGPVTLWVVDHLLNVRPANPRDSRHAQMGQIVYDLFEVARATGTHLLALYQLNRSSETEKREPLLSDLRESGTIEEYADRVWLLHRPNFDPGFSEATLFSRKERQGEPGPVPLLFQAARTLFVDRTVETA